MPISLGKLLCAVSAILVLSVPASASAQGVQVDPNSPAGTEYDIPIDRARREAQGGSSAGGAGGGSQLFGAGIESDAADQAGGGASGGGSADTGSTGDALEDGQQVGFATSGGDTGGDAGSGSLIVVIAITLTLVGAALLGGWAIRRRTA